MTGYMLRVYLVLALLSVPFAVFGWRLAAVLVH